MTEPSFDLRVGDVREQLRALPDDSVQAVVTSPPYWQLRDYGTEPQVWGGAPEHEHVWGGETRSKTRRHRTGAAGGLHAGRPGHTAGTSKDYVLTEQSRGQFCECGAWYGELGQEPSPQLFVEHLVEVFEEVRRVLRPDGVCFVNIDDTYCANRTYQVPSTKAGDVGNSTGMKVPDGLKSKDLALVPQRLSVALQDAGWWVRCDILWTPPNTMPESVTDRPSRAHEYIWMLTKGERYFWDQEAVREDDVNTARPQVARARELFAAKGLTDAHLEAIRAIGMNDAGKAKVTQSGNGKNTPEMQALADEAKAALGGYYREFLTVGGRNLRSVWPVPTENFYGAHYAVMPVKLASRMIAASTSEKGCCASCGAPVRRVVERESISREELPVDHPGYRPGRYDNGKSSVAGAGNGQRYSASSTVGWEPGCSCGAETVPCTVLDPFGGACTTAMAARRLGRSSVAIELSPDAAAIGARRMESWWKDSAPQKRVDEAQVSLLDV